MTVATWVELTVAALLVLSGVLVLVSAVGFLRLPDFFLRMHPPALAYTLGCWTVALAAALYFSVLQAQLLLHPLLIPAFLAVTVPVTTLLIARATVFRSRRAAHPDAPPALRALSDAAGGDDT